MLISHVDTTAKVSDEWFEDLCFGYLGQPFPAWRYKLDVYAGYGIIDVYVIERYK